MTDTLLGQELQGPVQPGMPALGRASTGLTDALGRSTANIIANTVTGTVSQVIQTRFAGGRLNYANIASDAFGNALANNIGSDIGNSIVASQQAGQLTSAQAAASEVMRMNGMNAYGANAGSFAGSDSDSWSIRENGSNTSTGAGFGASIAANRAQEEQLFGVRNGVGLGAYAATSYPLREGFNAPPVGIREDVVNPGFAPVSTTPNQGMNGIVPNRLITAESVTGMDTDRTPGYRATEMVGEAYENALQQIRTMPVKQIFDANNPNQYLIFASADGTRNAADQAIPTNPRSLYTLARDSGNERAQAIYITGVGTEHDLGGLNSALGLGVPLQVSQTLAQIADRVNAIRAQNSDAEFVFVMTGFSRGSAVTRQVENALVQQGIPDFSSRRETLGADGEIQVTYDRNIIAPGAVNIGASLLYDTVKTGIANTTYGMAIPSQVQQTLHITALNEYRDTFPLTSAFNADGHGNDNIVELQLPGAHTNIGGGSYDRNGIGAANLELGYTYLQRAGVPLAALPDSMRPDPSQFVIYDSRFRIPGIPNSPLPPLVNNPNVVRNVLYPRHN